MDTVLSIQQIYFSSWRIIYILRFCSPKIRCTRICCDVLSSHWLEWFSNIIVVYFEFNEHSNTEWFRMNKTIPNDNNERDLQPIHIQVSHMSINLIFDCVGINEFEWKIRNSKTVFKKKNSLNFTRRDQPTRAFTQHSCSFLK